jgi:hypothetical protein
MSSPPGDCQEGAGIHDTALERYARSSRLQEPAPRANACNQGGGSWEWPLQLGRVMSLTKNPWAMELLRLGRQHFGTVTEQGAALEFAGCAPVDAPATAPATGLAASTPSTLPSALAAAPTLVAHVGRAVARFQPRPPLERVGRAVRDGGRLLLGPGAGTLTPADCSLGK